MKTFEIWAEIKCNNFIAENEEEARKLFWDSISDDYGISSSTDLHEIKEVRGKK